VIAEVSNVRSEDTNRNGVPVTELSRNSTNDSYHWRLIAAFENWISRS